MTIDIADFFTIENEEQGIWYEPLDCGIEFKLLGASSDAAVTAGEQYDKDLTAAEKEQDVVKRARLNKDALVKRLAATIVDVRGKDGVQPEIKGKPLVYSKENILAILNGSAVIRDALLKGLATKSNFMMKKH